MRFIVSHLPWFCLTVVSCVACPAQEERIPHAQDKPPGPPLSSQQAIAKMTVPEGFSVELVASEPDIVNPVAMTIDERGRFWITESLAPAEGSGVFFCHSPHLPPSSHKTVPTQAPQKKTIDPCLPPARCCRVTMTWC